jgi:hypothetical protein
MLREKLGMVKMHGSNQIYTNICEEIRSNINVHDSLSQDLKIRRKHLAFI